ncbi:histidinol-phosphate aminotransferase [Rhodovibrio sodomensis]|uniref:Histidinol-phosphate aminotransferase n=1 Tax=Rhodovibrio sodomensis TaxID=1088 RepID=A0ABS1DD43_9PROT|nr:aminotransferase class I/II-fold pyridoxal phosphate-dependent enzyme [Rhodovibrio sodomensis]MBK1667804.1 histidinol-phosphate aminotransferase [Rhodovibrio sodomensis]
MSQIPFTDIVAKLPASVPFVGPEQIERERGFTFRAKLGANESPFGPSPKAIEAIRAAAGDSWNYPDATAFGLREAVASFWDVPVDSVLVGAGIDELLGNVVRMTVPPGGPVVTSNGAYPTFNYHVNGFGGVLHAVDYRDDHEDLTALADTARAVGARLVYLSNPDNPMGTRHPAEAIAEFRRRLPEGTLLALDEAYTEFAPAGTNPPMDPSDPGVIRLRTFSKIYGLAGLRVGYAIAHPDAITALNKIRNHFGVNHMAQQAARAALQDQAYIDARAREIETGKQLYAEIARRHGFTAIPSYTNFVTIDVGTAERGEKLLTALQDRRVFIRKPGVPPLDRCIRVTVGPETERAIFEQAFAEAVDEVG